MSPFDLYATERRATRVVERVAQRVLILGLIAYRRAVLTKYLAGDIRARIRGDKP